MVYSVPMVGRYRGSLAHLYRGYGGGEISAQTDSGGSLEAACPLPRHTILGECASWCALFGPFLSLRLLQEHIIDTWGEEDPRYHNELVKQYQVGVQELLPDYKSKLGHRQRAKPGEEQGKLGKLRSKLLKFLHKSQHYEAAAHISSFPIDGAC